MALATSRHFLPVTRELLRSHPPDSPQGIFRRAGVPKSQGYRALRFYEVHGAVRVRRGIECDPRRILTLQGGLRAERAIPERHVAAGPPLEEAVRILNERRVAFAVGFQTAANMHAYFEPAGVHAIYVERSATAPEVTATLSDIEEALGRAGGPRGEPYELFVDDLARLEVETSSRGPVTSPLQTILDLCIHSRTAAHREFMFDQLTKQGALHG